MESQFANDVYKPLDSNGVDQNLDDLFKQLNISKGKNFYLRSYPDNELIQSLPPLIAGLESCKKIISNQSSTSESKSNAWSKVLKTVEMIANFAKNEISRDPLGASGAVDLIVQFMQLNDSQSYHSIDYQCLRALANFCINSDINRQRILDSGGINAVIVCLRKQENLDDIRAACAVLLNAGLQYDQVNSEIIKLDGIIALSNLFEPENILKKYVESIDIARTTVYFATRVLLNLIGTDEGKSKCATTEVITALTHLLSYASSDNATSEDVDIIENVIRLISFNIFNLFIQDEVQQILVKDKLFCSLLDFLEHSKPPEGCDQRIDKIYGESKAAVLKVIVSTTMSDKNMDPLFDDTAILNRLLNWLELGPERDDLQMCAALSLGNLARSVHDIHIVVPLANALKTSSNIKVQHAAISALKNLSIAAENKDIIGSSGIIGATSPLLEKDTVQPLQFAVVGIFKHLSSQNVKNSLKIILGENENDAEKPLTRLLNLIKRTDDLPIRSEGTRILVNLVKNMWVENPNTVLEGTPVSSLRSELNRQEVVQPLANMIIESKYPILQNEGIIALTLLLMDDSAGDGDSNPALNILTSKNECKEIDDNTASQPITHSVVNDEIIPSNSSTAATQQEHSSISPLLKSLFDMILSERDKYADEIKCNVCLLLEKSVKASCGARKQYLKESILPPLTSLLEQNQLPDKLKSAIERIIKCLN
ncbi:17143_t:CDS:10 [Dentiscutata heterogama]|uniref:17143_t:CDS:1 n=1 Tax=Dentiscutata heterogama TaxID=1316150 RepID=A0ACA9LY67_9GLOM|nr:17143_t:CDS:10 [Dentiscutata heterogama]